MALRVHQRGDPRCSPPRGGDDPEGGGGRAGSRRRQGRDLHAVRGRPGRAGAAQPSARLRRLGREPGWPLHHGRGRGHRRRRPGCDRRAHRPRHRPASRARRHRRPQPAHCARCRGRHARLCACPLRVFRARRTARRRDRLRPRRREARTPAARNRRPGDRLGCRSLQARAGAPPRGELGRPGRGDSDRVRGDRPVRPGRRDQPRKRRRASVRDRLRLGQQPTRRRGACAGALGARHPLRAGLHRQRRRPDQRLPRDPRVFRGGSARAGPRDRGDARSRAPAVPGSPDHATCRGACARRRGAFAPRRRRERLLSWPTSG